MQQTIETTITLETLPKAFALLKEDVTEIKKIILQASQKEIPKSDRWLSLSELIDFLPDRPRKSTIYKWVHYRLIPHHKGPKRLRFLQSEIEEWLNNGKVKTLQEVSNEAALYKKKEVR